MKGLENTEYLIGFIGFNILAIVFILLAVFRPRSGRLAFFFLFAWACVMNWSYSQNDPLAYQEYAALSLSDWYIDFIQGWFKNNASWVVAIIATCQGLIAFSMLLKDQIYQLGVLGGIVFLLAIAPLGVGSGFPCTISFAIALMILFKKGKRFIWVSTTHPYQIVN